jgi:hypothetical protein
MRLFLRAGECFVKAVQLQQVGHYAFRLFEKSATIGQVLTLKGAPPYPNIPDCLKRRIQPHNRGQAVIPGTIRHARKIVINLGGGGY